MPDYWNRQIERWMDIFSDDEPDLTGLELVREFDNLTKKFYSIFDDDLNEWNESSQILGIRSEIVREEVDVVLDSPYPVPSPNKNVRAREIKRKVEPVTASAKRHSDKIVGSRIEKVEQDSSEDVIVSDNYIKMVLQLPINNKKENIKVVTHDDNRVTISYLDYSGKRCTRISDIPYNIDFETANAIYKNGILEITFDRK
jgi:HSP20 family molecular chaperone IbpA